MYRAIVATTLITAIGVVGCGGLSERDMIANSRGASYSQGYGDGCHTAKREIHENNTTKQIDTIKYAHKTRYKDGWDDGYKECLFREKKVKKRIGESVQK
jgi:hypothetical protein